MMPTSDTPSDSWNPFRYIVAGVAAIVLLVGGLGGWSAFAKLSGAVIAGGELRAEGNRQVVQHQEGGIVAEILVRDGDHVASGDVLFRLDETRLRAELAIVDVQLNEALARIARLNAERDGRDQMPVSSELKARMNVDPEFEAMVDGQLKLFEARLESLRAERTQLSSLITQTLDRIQGAKDQIIAYQRQIGLIEQEIESQQGLFDKGLATAAPLLTLKRDEARLSGEIAALRATIAAAQSEIAATRVERLQLDGERREQAIGELRDLRAEVAERRQQRIAIADQLTRMEIRAPLGGIVHALAVHSRQAVIEPAEPLLHIVPEDEALVVEVSVKPTAIDNLHVGQDAALRFPAFNMRTTPSIPGVISNISADRHINEKTDESYYKVEIALAGDRPGHIGDLQLLPGMPVEAHIRTAERTPISYLIKPLADQLERAMRED